MKTLLSCLTILISVGHFCTAQDQPVYEYISQYNVTPQDLEACLKDANAIFRFDAKVKTIIGQDTSVQLAAFDPLVPVSEKWVILAKDDKEPTKKEFKTFYKNHNTKKDNIDALILSESWHIESEDINFLVVSFLYYEPSLPRKYHFLAKTRGYAHINKQAKRLMHVIFKNESPQNVKQYKVSSYELFMKYYFDTKDELYLIEWEDLTMQTNEGKIKELTEFWDYRRVK